MVAFHLSRAIAQTPGDTATVRASEQADERPVVIGQSQTPYGTCLREAGVSGHELIHLVVDTTGHVESGSVVLDQRREPILDSVAIAVGRGLIFRPARVGGSRVRVTVTVPLDFDRPTTGVASADSAVFSLGCVDHPPVMSRSRPLRYPELLVAARIAGEALVEFVVDTSGRAETRSIQLVRSSQSEFGSAARTWVGDARFGAARLAGVPVRCRARMRFLFQIGEAATSESGLRPGELPAMVITAWPS